MVLVMLLSLLMVREFNGTVVNGTGGVNLTEVIPGEHNVTVIFRDAMVLLLRIM